MKYYPKVDMTKFRLVDKTYKSVETDTRVKIVREIQEAAAAASDKIISTTAGYSDTFYETARVHSNGFSGETAGTFFWAGAEATVRDGESETLDFILYSIELPRQGNNICSDCHLLGILPDCSVHKYPSRMIYSGTQVLRNYYSISLLAHINPYIQYLPPGIIPVRKDSALLYHRRNRQ